VLFLLQKKVGIANKSPKIKFRGKGAGSEVMKMNRKRIVALLLVAVLIPSSLSIPSMAATGPSVSVGTATYSAGQQYFQNLTITGDGIRTVLISFSDNVTTGDKINLPATTPAGFTVSGASNDYTKRVNLAAGTTSGDIQNYLRSIGFTVAGESQRVSITVSTESVSVDTFYNTDTGHYYQYVAAGALGITWTNAYAAARAMTYMGRTGYLATVTSLNEDTFLNSLSGGKTGWLGGTIMNNNGGRTTASGSADNSGQYYGSFIDTVVSTGWYWACGPEIGQIFYSLDSTLDASGATQAIQVINADNIADAANPGTYYNWSRSGANEPNNSGSSRENCLTTLNVPNITGKHGTTFSWNDIRLDNINQGNTYAAKGYFVEYGNLTTGDSGSGSASFASASGELTGKPSLTAGKVVRATDTEGTVKFTSDRPGAYYYEVVADGAAAPVIDTSGSGSPCIAGENTVTNPMGLTAGAKEIYIVVKDTEGKVSDPIDMAIPVPNDVALTTTTWQSATTYTCGLELSPSAKMVTISVNNGSFTVPSLGGGALTFRGGTNGSTYVGTYTSATQQFDSAVFSFADTKTAESLLSGIIYKTDGSLPQKITASASAISPIGNDIYFNGHFYRYVAGSIDWPSAVLAAGGTNDPYFGGRGYIATATSQPENSILLKLTDTGGNGSDHWYDAWMGGLWQRNSGTVANPDIIRGADGNEVSYGDLLSATTTQKQNILLDYSMTFSDFNMYDTSTYIYAKPDTVKYYWIDGPEAGQEIAYNVDGFSPWHAGEPNSGDFVYTGWEGAYWDDFGAYNGDNPANGYAKLNGYVLEFSGFDGGATTGIIKEATKTTAVNTSPTFLSGTTDLSVDANSVDNDVQPLLHVSDKDLGQTLTWTEQTAPSHGTLDISGATASSGGTDIAPGGAITYTPTSDYIGTDTFTVEISDGTAVATRTINVTIDDVIPPTGKIIVAANQWSSFFNNITFGLFFKNTIDVHIEGTDVGSGVRSIEYYKSGAELSPQDLQTMPIWTPYSTAFSITPADAEQFVIYARITDNEGNVSIINSNGMSFDMTPPSISTDYTKGASSMAVTVGDSGSGLGTVSYAIDGGSPKTASISDGKFTIDALGDGKYDIVITATDAVGNEDTLTVHVVSLHTVTFKLFDGAGATTLKTEMVEYGDAGTAPDNPVRTGFDFQGWDKSFGNITSDLTVYGTWGIAGITATPYAGTFDGLPHDSVNVSGVLAGDTVTYSIDGTAFSTDCPQVTDAGSYSVYVKVERNGYAPWQSELKTGVVDTKEITSDMVSQLPSTEYTGQPQTPMPKVRYGTIQLVNNADFNVSYTGNVDFGLANATITGKGNYSGTVTTHFPIFAKNTGVVTGQGQTPQVTVAGLENLYQDGGVYTEEDSRIEQLGGKMQIDFFAGPATNLSNDKMMIQRLAPDKTIGLYLDLSLYKTVTLAGETGITTRITHVNDPLTITIPMPANVKGKNGIALYRVHDNVASVLPIGEENAIGGEYCTVEGQNIILHVCNFSTYAIGYDQAQTGAGDGGAKPDTGDDTNLILLMLLLCCSLPPVIAFRVRKRIS